ATYTLRPLTCQLFFFRLPPPPRSTLFPYTTLFRSQQNAGVIEHPPHVGTRPVARAEANASITASARTPPTTAPSPFTAIPRPDRSEEHTSELQSRFDLVCRLLLEKKNIQHQQLQTH